MWYQKLLNTYKAGISHEFLLYFNIRDVVDNQRNLEKYLYEEFIKPRNFAIVAFYDICTGLTFLDAGMEKEFNKITQNEVQGLLKSSPSRLFPYIDKVLKGTKMFLFINHTDKLIPANSAGGMSVDERTSLIWLCEWSIQSKISSVGSVVTMTADSIEDVNRELFNSAYKIEPIIVELPSENERTEYLNYLLKDNQVKMEIGVDEFAKLSSGLNKKAIKDIKLKAEAEGVPVSFSFIKDKKHSVLSKEYGDVLEFIYPEIGFDDIGGMDKVKKYLIDNVVKPLKTGNTRRVPMGILLCGPSGTGKTLLVKALAKASGFNCVKIDMSRILGQYVGMSERNFKKCLIGAKSQQPVIVFVDEIDTAFRRGENDSNGVSSNIFSEFLQFTSDEKNRGKVVFIAATNRPDLLDAALKRAGRFDKKIPILAPEENERIEILKIMIKKYGMTSTIEKFDEFGPLTENYTGAEMDLIVRKAYELSFENEANIGILDAEILKQAISRSISRTQDVEKMTILALNECDDLDLIPDKYRNIVKDSIK